MKKQVHIVALNTPYPVSYGGAFDIFHKLTALHAAGVGIQLHCFGEEQPELNKYCEQVFYYRRKKFSIRSLTVPFIVASRDQDILVRRLMQNDDPILLEGIHCTAILKNKQFAERRIVLRLHNVEYQYYRQLFSWSTSFFKKMYYLRESMLLKKYEARIPSKVATIAAVSGQDVSTYQNEFKARNIVHLPVFHGFKRVASQQGSGSYCLYHGNLSVEENDAMAIWLITEIFAALNLMLIIAGRSPSPGLRKIAAHNNNVKIIPSPGEKDMQQIIRDAQVHVLPSFNCTGVKLKLLNALYNGRHCVVNQAAVAGSGVEALCHIADDAQALSHVIRTVFEKPFTEIHTKTRRSVLAETFDTRVNTGQLIQLLW